MLSEHQDKHHILDKKKHNEYPPTIFSVRCLIKIALDTHNYGISIVYSIIIAAYHKLEKDNYLIPAQSLSFEKVHILASVSCHM